MAQQFQSDAVVSTAPVTVTTTAETTCVTSNQLSPPFGSYKAKVAFNLLLTVGTATTTVTMKIRRNPLAENQTINQPQPITVIPGNTVQLDCNAIDPVSDGRSVSYACTVTQASATGNGSALAGCYVETTLLSG